MATTPKDDAGQAEVQKHVDHAEAKGHIGSKPGDIPNERYALTTGPDSPSAPEARAAARKDRED